MTLVIAGCSADRSGEAPAGPALGGVVADEPRAAQIGRDILAAGGSAADAATAAYFAMAVTLPSRASLGGGGVCMVFDPRTREAQTLEFLARAPSHIPADADRPTAVPGNVRGFYSLQARYGRLRWSQVLVGAENLARFGVNVSRAFAEDIAQVSPAMAMQPAAQQTFSAPGGNLVGEGDPLRQNDLAVVLSRVRTEGPGDFYGGSTAAKLTAGARAAGGSLDAADLQGYEPVWRPALTIKDGGVSAHFPLSPPPAGVVAAQTWAMLVGHDRFEDADPVERMHLLAEAEARAAANRDRWQAQLASAEIDPDALISRRTTDALLSGYDSGASTPAAKLGAEQQTEPQNPAAASVIAVDVTGLAVSCQVTPNNLFGTGRVAPGTGIVLAATPGPGGRGATALGPMLVSDGPQFRFAAAASGGQVAPTTMVGVAAAVLLADVPLTDALAARRVHRTLAPDLLYAEQGLDPEAVRGLAARGHQIAFTPTIGRAIAAYCPNGNPNDPAACTYAADPRGTGLAARAD
ncbi:MAG: gamma-glutamyltransferase [Rhodospirillales bacterium]|nr:gamma-glutamyltransferase [Rhodospirillales bacterium]